MRSTQAHARTRSSWSSMDARWSTLGLWATRTLPSIMMSVEEHGSDYAIIVGEMHNAIVPHGSVTICCGSEWSEELPINVESRELESQVFRIEYKIRG